MRGSPERGYFCSGCDGTGGGDSGSGRRHLPPGLPFVNIHEQTKTPGNLFPKGCTPDLGLGLPVVSILGEKTEEMKNRFQKGAQRT